MPACHAACAPAAQERTISLLQQFSEPFRTAGQEPLHYELWGKQA